MPILPENWVTIFLPETPFLELGARGSALYFGVLVFVRLMPRRTGGEIALMDLIFVLLIAEAAAHALGDYSSVADGLIVIGTLMFWVYVVNALSFYIPTIEKLVSPSPIPVIHKGQLLRRNMRKEYLTEEELMTHLREAGIDKMEDVKSAVVEGDGRISVVRN